MKATGIVRRIDDLGRVTLPKEFRKTHNMPVGTPLEMFVDGENIIIRKYQPEIGVAGKFNSLIDLLNKAKKTIESEGTNNVKN